jgi:3',5'-cyclic AMP phosphodiesterase CpdA
VSRVVCCLVLLLATVASADPEEPAEKAPLTAVPVRGTSYALAAWRWQVTTAPRLQPQIGALAVSGLDVAAGRATAPLAVLGEGAAPEGWPFAVTGVLPAIPAATSTERVAVAFGVTTFRLGAVDEGVEMLELRLRYTDGVAAWLNGVEVVRRSLDLDASPTALAKRPHGPEWETFYIPVTPNLLRFGTNTLALEVHPSGRSDAPTISAELVGRRDRGILRGPLIAAVGATTATIAVETDVGTDASIEWGAGDVLDQHATSPPGAHHSFALANLPPRAQIRYRVHAGASQSAVLAFHTAPAAGDTIRIGIYGDVRGGHATHRKIVDAMLGEPLDLIAVTGDMVLHGSDQADWQRFFTITQPLIASTAYLPAVGNHDLGWDGADGSTRADELFTLPPGPKDRPAGTYWYSYDLADVHLVFLDSNAYERVEQEAWLAADLAAARARNVRAIFAFTHDGPYSRGYHKGNGIARTHYVPILAKYHVDYIFSGHDHLYQRGEAGGIRYVVTGGGGASLYAVKCGIPGKADCKVDDGMISVAREHHYLTLSLTKTTLELCVRRPDGRLLEPCTRAPLWRR